MNKGLYIILVILLLVLIFLNFDFSNFFSNKISQIFSQNQEDIAINLETKDCSTTTELLTVQGTSLDPFIKPGQTIKALFGYYDCHEIKRGDVVLFDYAGNKNPVIKIVKGVSGDKFELRQLDSRAYLIYGNAYKMLSLYEKDYKGVIPKNAYLLLGNRISGSVDSTTFGLVEKSDIIAKVEL
jgi:signal peptidase I